MHGGATALPGVGPTSVPRHTCTMTIPAYWCAGPNLSSVCVCMCVGAAARQGRGGSPPSGLPPLSGRPQAWAAYSDPLLAACLTPCRVAAPTRSRASPSVPSPKQNWFVALLDMCLLRTACGWVLLCSELVSLAPAPRALPRPMYTPRTHNYWSRMVPWHTVLYQRQAKQVK